VQPEHLDVLIVGAGISGIDAAYHLKDKCPKKTYAILEGRETLGGTWDLFRYPGIRSDSDMYTLGFPFRPWTSPNAIADGASILEYVRETAEKYGIDEKIRYRHRVERASWSSKDARWTVEAKNTATGESVRLTCSFLYMCSGYYDYESGYTPDIAGREKFRGLIVHPQKWTSDIAYEGKRVVVIGSGATAVTLVPEMAKKAAHVVMLQRSPSYVLTIPQADPLASAIRGRVPRKTASSLMRWKNVFLAMAVYNYCRKFPDRAKKLLVTQAERALRGKSDVKHFTPKYAPWDQRLCFVPDGDLFRAVREGRASVVTDHIDTFTEKGIRLKSGEELEADLVVTATGLNLKVLGGLELTVDGERVDVSTKMAYKGLMCSDVPNVAFAIGYTNASWTLKCDLTSEYVCRLLNYMDEHGYTQCVPRRDPKVAAIPLIDFSSGYVTRSIGKFPKQGSVKPWRLYQNYLLDRITMRRTRLDDRAMEFSTPNR
jgi:cation diffusion facilitator CzcD-associated flavoprotein CzcO